MSNAAETVFQIGIESTRGTAVAATRKLYCVADLPTEDDNIELVKQARDNYIANYDALQTKRQAAWTAEDVCSYDELHLWAQLFAKGGVSGSGAGPYIWTFNGAAASDDLSTATLEAGDNVAAVEVPFLTCTNWEISGQSGKPVMGKYSFIGQKVVDTTLTGAISDRDLAGSYMLFKNAAVYLDDTAGGIGGTEITNALMAFSLKCDNKVTPNFTGNNSGLFSSINREERYVEVTLDLLLDATTYTEFTDHYVDGEARFGQINIPGSGNDDFTFNFHVKKWHKFEPKKDGSSRRIILMGQTAYDPTLGYDWQFVITNDESAL